jgi:hypothetical protein
LPDAWDQPFNDDVENVPIHSEITTPGRLDILAILRSSYMRDELASNSVQSLVLQVKTPCGQVLAGRLAVDKEGWREDWALLSLRTEYRGKNGVWWTEEKFGPPMGGNGRLIGCADPVADGGVWYKEGATTGWKGGKMSKTEFELFLKGTTLPVNPESPTLGGIHPCNAFSARLSLLVSLNENPMAADGDSGSGPF